MNAVLKPTMHPDEWKARVELAAAYRVFDMLGWAEMIYNHITVRLPDSVTGGEKQFLINPFGLHYSEVTASNLLKIDVNGRKLDADSPWPVNPAGFTIHAAIHESVPDAQKRLTVMPPTLLGRPASTAPIRATLRPCCASGIAQPQMMSSIAFGSSPGTAASAAFSVVASRSSGRVLRK